MTPCKVTVAYYLLLATYYKLMNLPKITDLDIKNKRVLVRADLDVPLKETINSDKSRSFEILDDSRLRTMVKTVRYLVDSGARDILIIGHIGRFEGENTGISTGALWGRISELIDRGTTSFWPDISEGLPGELNIEEDGKIGLMENLRMWKFEEENSQEFAKRLASGADLYVNEAFASSHRLHASIAALPFQFKSKFKSKSKNSTAVGFHFQKEVENLSKVIENPKRPLVVLISGIKRDKVKMAKELTKIADKVLVGGKLPKYFGDTKVDPEKMVMADLTFEGFDITLNSIERFKKEIKEAGTIVLAGVLGKYEDEGHRQGTKEVFTAVAESNAFKIAGGGDTEAALTMLSLTSKFDWISVGGGAMLEFLASGTLPGIEALKKRANINVERR